MTPQIEILVKRRTKSGLSVAKLARKIGIDRRTLFSWENYIATPNIYMYINWSQSLGYSFTQKLGSREVSMHIRKSKHNIKAIMEYPGSYAEKAKKFGITPGAVAGIFRRERDKYEKNRKYYEHLEKYT